MIAAPRLLVLDTSYFWSRGCSNYMVNKFSLPVSDKWMREFLADSGCLPLMLN